MILIINSIIAMFLGVNMGAGGFSVAFTPSCGSGLLKKNKAALLYAIFLFLGAVLIGPRVITTLTAKIGYQGGNGISALLIVLTALCTMFAANLLKIPQSTSFVSVSAFAGAGLYYKSIQWLTLLQVFAIALVFSLLAFLLTYWAGKCFYPPRNGNLHFYETQSIKKIWLRRLIIWTNCYAAFAVGTNNVANVAAPLIAGGLNLHPVLLLALTSPLLGLGGLLMGKGVLNTLSREIIPIGALSASVISLITSSFVILASLLGVPTPYVQFTTFAVLAISCLKDGLPTTLQKLTVKKMLIVWMAVPLVTGCLSYLLHVLFIR